MYLTFAVQIVNLLEICWYIIAISRRVRFICLWVACYCSLHSVYLRDGFLSSFQSESCLFVRVRNQYSNGAIKNCICRRVIWSISSVKHELFLSWSDHYYPTAYHATLSVANALRARRSNDFEIIQNIQVYSLRNVGYQKGKTLY